MLAMYNLCPGKVISCQSLFFSLNIRFHVCFFTLFLSALYLISPIMCHPVSTALSIYFCTNLCIVCPFMSFYAPLIVSAFLFQEPLILSFSVSSSSSKSHSVFISLSVSTFPVLSPKMWLVSVPCVWLENEMCCKFLFHMEQFLNMYRGKGHFMGYLVGKRETCCQ